MAATGVPGGAISGCRRHLDSLQEGTPQCLGVETGAGWGPTREVVLKMRNELA